MIIRSAVLMAAMFGLYACTTPEPAPVGECEPEIVAYAKDGTPIYAEVAGVLIAALEDDNGTSSNGGTPPDNGCLEPPCDDPVIDDGTKSKSKCNCGKGNGPEGDPDCDPGNSGNTPAARND
ncbi:MAG TPA: hypothetical protein VLA51_02120 [Paracoccaceae bacterium]|nr:hypothetical protein [Paracoccaceae bacterium]